MGGRKRVEKHGRGGLGGRGGREERRKVNKEVRVEEGEGRGERREGERKNERGSATRTGLLTHLV